ncbi:MAG TPA: hypothetical protein VNE39_29525 [Planctomycetota bacterium]|nr:hypothetical protein [Planctomycetota bacterium]
MLSMAAAPAENRPLSREDLASCTERVLRHATGAKPAILLVVWAGRRLIVKDFAENAWPLRHVYGRWIVANEARVYSRLAGVEGVPTFRGRLDALAFAVDYIEATSLKAHRRRSLPAAVFDRLAALQASLHERGVVHLDAHQSKNVLLPPDGGPFLVDFATSLRLGGGWVARRLLTPFFAHADRLGLQKLKARYCADPLTPAEARRDRILRVLGWLWPHTAFRRLRRRARRRAVARQPAGTGRLDRTEGEPKGRG